MYKTHNAKGEKLEKYYQIILEQYTNGKHEKLDCGITDITTSDMHIEIKKFSMYKQALGQLIAYKQRKWKPKLYAVFFGNIKPEKKEIVIDVFKSNGIGVCEIIDNEFGITLNTLVEAIDEMEIDG